MKKTIFLFVLTVLFTVAGSAQKLEKPKLTPQPATPAQNTLIGEGIALHNAKRYDDAVKKYEAVLQENPDCTVAIYEMAFSLFSKPDRPKAVAMARRGAAYKSDQLARFYSIIASDLDDSGKSEEAIEVFKDAIKILKNDKTLAHQMGDVAYNMGITHFRRKEYNEARTILKEGITANFAHPGSHFLLAEIFSGTRYKIPAVLAAMRFMGFERQNPARVKRASTIILDVLNKTEKDEKTGNINIFLDMGAPKDEGDYGLYELLGSIGGIETDEDKAEKKTEGQRFVESIASIIGMLADDKKLRGTFAGKTYIPYFDAMKKGGYHEPMAYIILQEAGNDEGIKWISINPRKVLEYHEWTRSYQAPAK